MNKIKKIPLPLSGVMLGTAALGNLLQSYGEGIRYTCGIFSAFLLILLLLKIILFPGSLKKDLNNPILAGVSCTFPMGIMLLSTYIKPLIGAGAQAIWWIAIALHIVLILYFTVMFVFHFSLRNVFTVWYIVYCGIAVSSVSAPAYGQTRFGAFAFWFALISLFILLVVVTVRYAKLPVPEPARPLICIYAAPASLCTAAYVQSVTPKSYGFLLFLAVLSGILYVFALFCAVRTLRLPFYPSYAAYTFPFVISAIAFKQTMACAANLSNPLPALQPIVLITTVIAAVLVVYTYVRFMMFLFD